MSGVPPYSPRATDEYEHRQSEIGCEVCGRKPVRTARMEDHTRHVVCPLHGRVWGDFNPWPYHEHDWPDEFRHYDRRSDLDADIREAVVAGVNDLEVQQVVDALAEELDGLVAIYDVDLDIRELHEIAIERR